MEIKHFSIWRGYEIACKLFLPRGREVTHITIGVHGFAGDKESSMLETLARNHPQAKLHILEDADHRFKKPGQIDSITQLAGNFLFS